ncbi:MAG: hypothetical protein IKY83_13245 [Proteobacteria bacterium]|nr:hypothetical protein [Pseudomonadota bacterium]
MHGYYKTWSIWLSICCALGCTDKPTQPQTDTPAQPDVAEPAHPQAQPTPMPEAPSSNTACLGGTEDDENCLCDKVAIARADAADWACGEGFWRCVNNDGCMRAGIHYPAGTDITENDVQCGLRGDIPEREKFKCQIDENAWICQHQSCACYGSPIKMDDKCLSRICQGVEIENNKGLTCTANGWEVFTPGDYTIDGNIYKLDYDIMIRKGVLVCDGHEIPWNGADNYKYQCRDIGWKLGKHWTCLDKKGCACGDSKCKQGEQCENGKCSAQVKACEKGNCPCGDGFCMKDGVCVQGHCICGERDEYQTSLEVTSNGEPPINEKQTYWDEDGENIGRHTDIFTSNRFGEFTCTSYTDEGTCHNDYYFAQCEKEEGCWTSDGRHYEYNATAPQSFANNEYFHVDAGFDLTFSSPESGTCVLERHDDIKSWKEAGKKATTFLCDEKICKCGKHKCHLGQVCREGKCENDTCQIDESFKIKKYIQEDPDCEGADPNDPSTHWEGGGGSHDEEDYDPEKVDPETEPKPFDQEDQICPGEWVTTYDTKTCKGGTLWCHGTADKTSRQAPKEPKGYKCKDVKTYHADRNSWSYDETHKVWECEDSSCKCGGEFCPRGANCIDEKCLYLGQPVPDEFKKENCWATKDYYYCSVDDDPDATICYNEPKPGEGYVCAKYNQHGWKCTAPEGCTCAGKFAPTNTVCREGKLLCGLTEFKDGDSHQYTCKTLPYSSVWAWSCADPDGCTCGNLKCQGVELCQSGSCTCGGLLKPDTRYTCSHTYSDIEYLCTGEEDCDCPYTGKTVAPNDGCKTTDYQYATIKNNAYYCGDTPMPDIRNGYMCSKDHEIVCNHTTCPCGTGEVATNCPKFSICADGKCLHPQTHQPIATDDNGNFNEGIMHLCLAPKGCYCEYDESPCTTGTFCTYDGCQELLINYDKGHYYAGFYEPEESEESDDTFRAITNPIPGWDDIYTSYYFHASEVWKGMCSSQTLDIEYSAVCGDSKGCTCAGKPCPTGATCDKGVCLTDEPESKCKLTQRATPRFIGSFDDNDFQCGTLGWTCTGENCPCGDTKCKPLEICLKPGTCVPVKN